MPDGDAVLVIDDAVCMELQGLADHWDARIRRNLADILSTTCTSVVLAVARKHGDLHPQDHAMWADLREELLGSSVTLLPLRGLPAT